MRDSCDRVDLLISGPETRSLAFEPSDPNEYAEAMWKTSATGTWKKGGVGTVTGSHSARLTNVAALVRAGTVR
jgi:hypothetical protein